MATLTIAAGDCCYDMKRSLRDVSPAHYTLEIDSFSDLQKMVKDTDKRIYESRTFEVGGYKWNLCLYPNGDEERNGKGYISMSLVIVETDSLALCWEVQAKFKIFVYNYIQNKFLKVQDVQKRSWRFDRKNTECGFPQFMLQTEFHDPNNGYLRRDKCIFGVEIGLCSLGKGEIIPPIQNVTVSYTWKLNQFSTSYTAQYYFSPLLYTTEHVWKFVLYPKGEAEANYKYISVYLCMEKPRPEQCVYADFKVTIVNQKNSNGNRTKASHHWFTAESDSYGWLEFMTLEELKHESNGFLVADSLHLEVQITGISSLIFLS